jgi:hypothetical protein
LRERKFGLNSWLQGAWHAIDEKFHFNYDNCKMWRDLRKKQEKNLPMEMRRGSHEGANG